MNPFAPVQGLGRRTVISVVPAVGIATASLVPFAAAAQTASSPLPSWNDGPAKRGIMEFVRTATDRNSANFVAPE